jgi:predicted N-acetyltransferase YhbS
VSTRYVVEPFDSKRHDRAGFSCGNSDLDRYLHRQAGQDVRRNVAAAFVAVAAGHAAVVGYYTLSALSIRLAHLPATLAQRLPRYPVVPVTLLGRLAVDTRHQGKKLGEYLLTDALKRSLDNTRTVGSAAVVVDAIDDSARAFYEHFGFLRLPDQPFRLFLPMQTIAQLNL